MDTRTKIDKVLILATGKTGEHLDKIKRDLSELGVVIKGQNLGVSHPHLASYFTIEPLIQEEYRTGGGKK